MNTLFKRLIQIAIIAAIGVSAFLYFKESLKITVRTEPVEVGIALNTVPANVNVVSSKVTVVKSLESGYVKETLKLPGEGALEVKQGDIICKLDTEELDFEIARIETELESLTAKKSLGSYHSYELELARKDLEHYQKLVDLKQYPKAELDKRQRDILRLQELIKTQDIEHKRSFDKNQSYLEQLKQRRADMEIIAPVDGLLTENYVYQGDYIYARNSVAKIISKNNIIQLSISEEDFPGIKLGLPISIKFLGYERYTLAGTIYKISPRFDSDTNRRTVFASIKDVPSNVEIVAGMTGEASITKSERPDSLIIPRRALIGREVFVVKNGIVEVRQVKTGFEGLQQVEIREGLEAGEQVVVENLNMLLDGDKVEVLSEG